jgi:hypothetical protein
LFFVTSTPSHIRSTNLTGGLRTLTAYAGVPYDKPATTISNSDDQSVLHSSATGTLDLPGLFENRGFCLGHINLDVRGGGSVMVIWRLARRRRARLPGIRIFVLTLDKFLESNDNSWVAMQPLKTKNGHFQTASLLTKHLNITRLMDFRLRFTFPTSRLGLQPWATYTMTWPPWKRKISLSVFIIWKVSIDWGLLLFCSLKVRL